MIFNANSKVLEKLLSKVIPAIPQRTPMPILENFLFEMKDGKLRVTATDLEIVLSSTINVESEKDFNIVVPAALLYNIVRNFGDKIIHFNLEKSMLTLKTDTGEYNLSYADAKEYPAIPKVKDEQKIVYDGVKLKRMLDLTTFAISKEAMRPAMMGTLFEFFDEGITYVASDGHKLVKYLDKSEKYESLADKQLIVPERAISVLLKLAEEGEIEITIGESNIAFHMGSLTLISRLIEQKYPDYNSVIPVENEKLMKVKRDEMLSVLKRMLLFATSNYQQVKISLSPNMIEMSTEDIDRGSSGKETIVCEYDGDPLEIGFNTGYLNDVLNHFDTDTIVFKMQSATKACILEPVEQKENEDLMMLLMPVRLNT